MRKVAVGAVVLGLALSACSTDGGGPQVGGVAAEVDGRTILLDEVETLTDAYCKLQTAQGQAAPRSSVSDSAAATLVQVAIIDELDLATDVTSSVPVPQVPGWDEMNDEERDAFRGFMDGQERLQTAIIELGRDGAANPEAAAAAGAERLAARVADELDVTVNPRYQFRVDDGEFVSSESLSFGVSAEATGSPDDMAFLASLPESQLCGVLPEQQSPVG